jgi:hypothetical protein
MLLEMMVFEFGRDDEEAKMISCANRGIHGEERWCGWPLRPMSWQTVTCPGRCMIPNHREKTPLLRGANLERMTGQSATDLVRERCLW